MFDTWMHQVNHWLEHLCGEHAEKLPDQEWRLWFEAGMDPKTAANRALMGSF